MSLRRRRPPQWLTFESNKAIGETIAITITRTAGAPTSAWRVVDGGQIYEYAGDALSHVVQVRPCKIECGIALKWIESIVADDQNLTTLKNLRKCINITSISCQINRELDFSLDDLPITLDSINFVIGLLIHGNLSNVKRARTVNLGACPLVGGDLADIPDVAEYVDLSGCSRVTGLDIHHAINIYDMRLHNQVATQARVNAIILDIWQHRASFTYSGAIACNLDGNNAAPSGNVIPPEEGTDWHQDGATWIPLTAGAMVYDLTVDVNSEGFNLWSITVS